MTTLTPNQFIKACLHVWPDIDPDDVAGLFRPYTVPGRNQIAEVAEKMADNLTAHESTLATHCRLMDIVTWGRA